MLLKSNNYDHLYKSFKWNIPSYFNIATSTIDKKEYQNRTALIDVLDNGKIQNWSFADIKKYSNKLANVFDHFQLDSDARVGIVLGQCPETAISHMACFKTGRISIPLFNLFGVEALYYRLMNSRASVVICDQMGLDKIKEIFNKLPYLKLILCVDVNIDEANILSFHNLLEKASDNYITKTTQAKDPGIIIYTSGTTGGPKGALLPHRALLGHIPGVEIPHHFLSSSEPVTSDNASSINCNESPATQLSPMTKPVSTLSKTVLRTAMAIIPSFIERPCQASIILSIFFSLFDFAIS